MHASIRVLFGEGRGHRRLAIEKGVWAEYIDRAGFSVMSASASRRINRSRLIANP
jgi:hypothetical protein